jgi:L-arabinose isomerase
VIRLEAYWEPFFCHAATYAASSEGPTHHYALGVGHHAGTLRKVARLLGLEFIEVGRN